MKIEKRKNKVDWEISERIINYVKTYAEYSNCSESEVVEKFLKNILDDKDFMEYRTKEIMKTFDILTKDSTFIKWSEGKIMIRD